MEIYDQTKKTITRQGLYKIRQQIKKDSFRWYKTIREGQYEYIHEFKERINEILDLQKKHHAIVDSPTEPTTLKQTSLAELHRLIAIVQVGDICTRTRNTKPQSSKVTSFLDMKDIVDLAIEKGVRLFVERTNRTGLSPNVNSDQSDETKFMEQLRDFS
jgi:hypothetical protein